MEKEACYHCGEDCGRHPVLLEEKAFCCTGCKSVFEILNAGELYKYYDLESAPGTKLNSEATDSKYSFLDSAEIQEQLLTFNDGEVGKLKFFIPNIHCASCIWLLENLGPLHPAVRHSVVNFVKKEIDITYRVEDISLRELAELLQSIGYAPQISLDDADKKTVKADKSIYYKIGVAGFAFGNIMLMSFPEYFADGEFTEKHFQVTFGWLNLLLSLPVAFYSATDYLVSAWKGIRHRYVNIDIPIALGIIILFVQSVYEVVAGSGSGYFDSLAGLVFFLLVGKWYQNKTYQALSFERDYKSYFPIAVTLLRDGAEETIPLSRLQVGNRILVRNQELIPADALLKRGEANVDFSFVTGEANPIRKHIGETIYAGGRQIGPAIEIEITREVEQSYLTQLWNEENGGADKSKLTSIVDKVSQYFTFGILFIAIATGVYWFFTDAGKAIPTFAAVLIVACPCALALALPFAFGSTMRIFGRYGFYLKKVEVIEKLSRINTVVFDKTGTITQSNAASVQFVGRKLSGEELQQVKSIVRHSTHPMSVAVFNTLEGDDYLPLDDFTETMAEGISAQLQGRLYKLGGERFVCGTSNAADDLATKVYLSVNDEQCGYFKVENKYRPELKTTLSELETAYDLHVLTGDNEGERENLLSYFREATHLHFNQKPVDKLNYIKQLNAQGKTVLMVGDGLNDAGALYESHAGISIADNIYHFSPACDAILESKQFGMLTGLLRFAKNTLTIVKCSYGISFLYNFVGLYYAVSGNLSPIVAAILMPLSSVTVVAFVTFATLLVGKKQFG